jgi:hypothetical protein
VKLYNYIITRDYGFAPNPFPPCCTLATCKPKIRNSAKVGDWIVGVGSGAKTSAFKNRLIYAMKVDDKIDFNTYWNDPMYARKKPVMNGSKKQQYGDNIYHRESQTMQYVQENSHHSLTDGEVNIRNYKRDLQSVNVLLSNTYWYFGKEAPLLPDDLLFLANLGIGHREHENEAIVTRLCQWLNEFPQKGYVGHPAEFSKKLNDMTENRAYLNWR